MSGRDDGAMLLSPVQALTQGFQGVLPGIANNLPGRFVGESRQGFITGDLRFMIRYEDGSELAEMPLLHRLPNAPEWFCGIANRHGKLIPVFDLANYFVDSPRPESRRMLLVLSHGGDATGVVIDGLPARLRLDADGRADAAAAPPHLSPHLRGIYSINGQFWFDLDVSSLLGELEQALVNQR